MKMRDELELYKGKSAELTGLLETVQRETELVVANLKDDHAETLSNLERTCEGKLSVLVAEHKKAMESKDYSLTNSRAESSKLNEQVKDLHDILDVIPGVMGRQKEGQYGNTDVPAHVRLASVLASKFM